MSPEEKLKIIREERKKHNAKWNVRVKKFITLKIFWVGWRFLFINAHKFLQIGKLEFVWRSNQKCLCIGKDSRGIDLFWISVWAKAGY